MRTELKLRNIRAKINILHGRSEHGNFVFSDGNR